MSVLMGTAFALSVVGVLLFFALPVMAVWLIIAGRRAEQTTEALRLNNILAGGLGGGLTLFCIAAAISSQNAPAATVLAYVSAALVGIIPLWAGARLLSGRAQPLLHRLIWALTVGASVLAVLLLLEVWSAARARQIGQEVAYETNPALAAAAVRQDPNNAAAHFGLARDKMRRGDDAGAVPELRTVVRLRPDDAMAARMLAATLKREAAKATRRENLKR
ncbi:MAG: hypothetical protein M3Y28_05675 [Armatimonadota bacterium]|nr:hypothetical protein [Armatimonadota bacterium]